MSDFSLREQRKKEVHNLKPGWFVRWGISVILIMIIMLLVLAHIVRYPDIIQTEAIITSSSAPANIIAKNTNSINTITINDGDKVNKGDLLIVYNNAGKTEDIFMVKNMLEKVDLNNPPIYELFDKLWKKQYELGDLQPAFVEVTSSLGNLYLLKSSETLSQHQKLISEQLILLKRIDTVYNQIDELKDEEREIMQARHDNDSSVRKQNIISDLEYTQSRINYLHSMQDVLSHNLSIENSRIKIKELENNKALLIAEHNDKLIQAQLQFINSIRQFFLTYKKWEEAYLVNAPITGIAYFQAILREENYVNSGDKIMTIVPLNESYEVHLKIPFAGAGKLENGQVVKIKLNDYPYKEYGCLVGKLENISFAANTDHYVAIVSLPNQLVSNFNKQILFKENMQGLGEIITDDRSVFGRIFENITYVFKK